MFGRLARTLATRLDEPTVHTLVRARHGELAWQERARVRRLARRAGTVPAGYVATAAACRGAHALVVDHFDAHEVRSATLQTVSQVLVAAGVVHAAVPEAEGHSRVVAISLQERDRALEALAAGLDGAEWLLVPASGRLPRRRPWRRLEGLRSASRLIAYRTLAAANGQVLGGIELACVVEFWREITSDSVSRPDGGRYLEGTRLAPVPNTSFVAYLGPARWQEAVTAPGHWSDGPTSLFQIREPIDIVYTWVDGSDPAWLARKAVYDSSLVLGEVNASALHGSRFASRDELRYSLRSVAMYASWVRRIFVVTDQQVPPWLDTTHPKIEVVDHAAIFRDRGALPVFNSHAIESQLHHIPGLSEHYLYLNDDFFFGRTVEPELFFHANGIAKFFLSKARLDIDPPSGQDLPVMSAAKRNRELIEVRFGATVVQKFKHTPHSQLRSVLEQLESEFGELFDAVSHSRFRHPEDLSITSALHHYYAYGLGRAVPAEISYVYQDIADANTERRLGNLLRTRHADVFCLNDHLSDPESFAAQTEVLGAFLTRMYPLPSPFELARVAAPNR